MAADAREYRETLALEKSFKENPDAEREWIGMHSEFVEATLDEESQDDEAQSA